MFRFLRILFPLTVLFNLQSAAQESAYSNYSVFAAQNKVFITCTINGGNTCNGISLYRSEDSIQFILIDQIQGTCGSSDFDIKYTFTDANPIKNQRSWYKLYLGNIGYTEALGIDYFDVSSGYLILNTPDKGNRIIFRNTLRNIYQLNIYSLSGALISSAQSAEEFFTLSSGSDNQIQIFELFNTQGSERYTGKYISLKE